ncbi:hypothetical protein F2Q69_00044147 [Brassica cretica]|uniref:Uncharacterized protein n=1 Tax=Brassica cretica TaxID=69181 RepID=A0A8S9NGQ1_BRACR|nr:hypothetical protein F2Q69_00044147 [Brassica cretica]
MYEKADPKSWTNESSVNNKKSWSELVGSTPLMDSVMVGDAFSKSLSDMEIIGNAHQLYDRKSLRATAIAKWNGVDTCHEDGWMRRVIQRCVGKVTNLPFDPEGVVCPTKCSAVVV